MFICVYVNVGKKNDEFLICKENIKYEKGDALKKIGNITIKESVIINGEKNYLYPTFDNPRKAMNNVKKEAHEFLDVIAAEYSLDELSDKNWEDYNSAVWVYNNDKYIEDKFLMEVFFCIYKGTYDNKEIKQIINKNDSEIYNRLFYLLPYNSPFCRSYYNEQNLK